MRRQLLRSRHLPWPVLPLVSSNGFDWQRGGRVFDRIPDSVKSYVPLNDGAGVWAPDVIKVGDQYFVYYAVSKWGSFVSAVGLMTSPTLDTTSVSASVDRMAAWSFIPAKEKR